MYDIRYSSQILIKIELSIQNFEKKFPNIKFYENPSIWEPICSMRTDRQTWRI